MNMQVTAKTYQAHISEGRMPQIKQVMPLPASPRQDALSLLSTWPKLPNIMQIHHAEA